MNQILALHIANPIALKELVGFRVETFYHSGNNDADIVFWEKLENGDIGKVKRFKTDSFARKCLEKIKEIQDKK